MALDEPVHHRVTLVRKDDEKGADSVVRSAPDDRDTVDRRAVSDDGHDRSARQGHAHTGGRGHREAESALRGAEVAEGLAGREPRVNLRAVDRRLLDDDRIARQPFRQRREHVARGESLARRRRRRRRRGTKRLRRLGVAYGNTARELTAHRRGRGEHGQLGRAPVQLVRIVSEHRDPRSRSGEATRHVRRLTERRRADDEDRVVRLQALPQPCPFCGQHAAEQRVVLREAGTASERLLEDGRHEPLCQLDERRPGLRVVGTRAHDQRRRLRLREEARERVDGRGVGGGGAQDGPERGRRLALLVGRLVPVVHRHDHERGTASRLRSMKRTLDRGRDVLCPGGLVDADGILATKAGQLPGEERLVGEMPTVLLPHDDDERRTIHAGGRQGTHSRAEPGRRVQKDESRPAAADREP